MREDDDRLRGRTSFYVIFQPFELFVAKIAEAAGLQIDHIDEADKVHAVGIEAVPAACPVPMM